MLNKVKELIVIFLITVYTATAFGVAINYHYCSGHLAHVSLLNFGGKSGCACNRKDMAKDCCKDELRYGKADNHKPAQQISILRLTSFSIELPAENNYTLIPALDGYGSDFIMNDVRRSCPDPIYLLNRVFRI